VVDYDGDTAIAGVPGTAAAVVLDFAGTQGSATGALLPTGNVTDVIDGVTVTCIDNGMPVVVVPSSELGCTGYETVAELEADDAAEAPVADLLPAAPAEPDDLERQLAKDEEMERQNRHEHHEAPHFRKESD